MLSQCHHVRLAVQMPQPRLYLRFKARMVLCFGNDGHPIRKLEQNQSCLRQNSQLLKNDLYQAYYEYLVSQKVVRIIKYFGRFLNTFCSTLEIHHFIKNLRPWTSLYPTIPNLCICLVLVVMEGHRITGTMGIVEEG